MSVYKNIDIGEVSPVEERERTKKKGLLDSLVSDEDTKIVKAVLDKKPCDDEWWYDDDLMNAYRNIDSVVFSYNEEGQKLDPTVGGEMRSGVIAQQVEDQPLLNAAVKTDPKTGYKMLDMRQISASNMAAISEIVKALDKLKEQVQQLQGN